MHLVVTPLKEQNSANDTSSHPPKLSSDFVEHGKNYSTKTSEMPEVGTDVNQCASEARALKK